MTLHAACCHHQGGMETDLSRTSGAPKDHIDRRILDGIPLVLRALEPECEILLFVWSFGFWAPNYGRLLHDHWTNRLQNCLCGSPSGKTGSAIHPLIEANIDEWSWLFLQIVGLCGYPQNESLGPLLKLPVYLSLL